MDDRVTRAHETSPAVGDVGRRRGPAAKPASTIGARLPVGAAGHRFALHVQRTLGNRALQRIIFDPTKTEEERQKGEEKPFHDRPSEPHREIPLPPTIFGGKEVKQSRHHIIPWNTLSAFVRTAYVAGHIAELHQALSPAIRTMMQNSPRYLPNSRTLLKPHQRGGVPKQGALTLQDLMTELRKSPGATQDPEAVWAITAAFCWMPGNLFLGPLMDFRLDDPGENFETHAGDQVGPRLERFKRAFDDMKSYSANPTVQGARKVASFLQSVAGKTSPIPFDERVWTRVENENGEGRYFLTRAADTDQVKAALEKIREAKAGKLEKIRQAKAEEYRALVEEHAAWHAAQQEVWAQQAEARKAAKKASVLQ